MTIVSWMKGNLFSYLLPRQRIELEPQPQTEQAERCVICHADTGVPRGMHVDLRSNYSEEGVGQLCARCALACKAQGNAISFRL